jgi:hypothetical protein
MPSTIGIVASHIFTPLDLAPDLWLDAADTTTITASGSPMRVSQWNNKGSRGNFTQGSSGAQPTTGASTVNGLNVLDFDGGDALNAVNQNEWKFLHDGTIWFFAAVWQAGTTANPSVRYGLFGSTSTGAEVGFLVRYEDFVANDAGVAAVCTGSTNAVTAQTSNNFHPANTPVVFSGRFDPANATAASRALLQVNAGSTSSPNTSTTAPSANNPSRVLQIGALGNFSQTLLGKIAELVIVSGTNATNANRELMRDYLNAKWGVY